MNLIEKIKANKEKQNQNFIKPEIVDVVIDNYKDIKEAIESDFSYEDVELALFNKSVEPFVIADICYIAGRALEKFSTAVTQAEIKTKIEQKETDTKEIEYISAKPSRVSIAKYMQDKNIKGYAIEFYKNKEEDIRYAVWIVSESERRAKITAYNYLADKDKKAEVKNSYHIAKVSFITYDEYLLEYGTW